MPDAYIICGTPRTGSTLLCDVLAATNVAGDPDSFFRKQREPRWVAQWQIARDDDMNERDVNALCLAAILRTGRGNTGIFGLRLMREDLESLSAFLDTIYPSRESDRARLESAFGSTLFIHLSRADKLAQAVSLVKAEQTGLWHVAPDGTEIERLAPPQDPVYDFDRIAREMAELEGYDAAWISWFERQAIEPLTVQYETLAADPAAVVERICVALGVAPPPAGSVQPGVAILSDENSRDWMRRYRDDCGYPAST